MPPTPFQIADRPAHSTFSGTDMVLLQAILDGPFTYTTLAALAAFLATLSVETASRTITIPAGSTTAEAQALLDGIKDRIASGVTITVDFADGDHAYSGGGYGLMLRSKIVEGAIQLTGAPSSFTGTLSALGIQGRLNVLFTNTAGSYVLFLQNCGSVYTNGNIYGRTLVAEWNTNVQSYNNTNGDCGIVARYGASVFALGAVGGTATVTADGGGTLVDASQLAGNAPTVSQTNGGVVNLSAKLTNKADRDASNLDSENVSSWKTALGVSDTAGLPPTVPSANQTDFAAAFADYDGVYPLAASDMGKVLTNLNGNKRGDVLLPEGWAETLGSGQVLVLNHGQDLVLRCEAGGLIGYDTLQQGNGSGGGYGSGSDAGTGSAFAYAVSKNAARFYGSSTPGTIGDRWVDEVHPADVTCHLTHNSVVDVFALGTRTYAAQGQAEKDLTATLHSSETQSTGAVGLSGLSATAYTFVFPLPSIAAGDTLVLLDDSIGSTGQSNRKWVLRRPLVGAAGNIQVALLDPTVDTSGSGGAVGETGCWDLSASLVPGAGSPGSLMCLTVSAVAAISPWTGNQTQVTCNGVSVAPVYTPDSQYVTMTGDLTGFLAFLGSTSSSMDVRVHNFIVASNAAWGTEENGGLYNQYGAPRVDNSGSGSSGGTGGTLYTSIATLIPSGASALLSFNAEDQTASVTLSKDQDTNASSIPLTGDLTISNGGVGARLPRKLLLNNSSTAGVAISGTIGNTVATVTGAKEFGYANTITGFEASAFTITSDSGLTEVLFEDVESVECVFTYSNSSPCYLLTSGNFSLTRVRFPNLKRAVWSNLGGEWHSMPVALTGQAFPQSAVDEILVKLASLDGTLGTTMWNGTVNISGGVSASPSAIGLAAKDVIVARGGTVITN